MERRCLRSNSISQRVRAFFLGLLSLTQVYAANSFPQPPTNPLIAKVVRQGHSHELIVLVHGLMRSSASMRSLQNYLEKQHYEVYAYNYPSSKFSIHEHGVFLNKAIKELLNVHPGVKIHFITHSLGGIIAREALAQFKPAELKSMGYLIMLAPPNQGSFLAKLSTKIFPFSSLIKPLAELSSDQKSYVHQVPIPKVKIGIIAGRFDAKVPITSARLKGQQDPVVVNATHTFIMNHDSTRKLIINFLNKGLF